MSAKPGAVRKQPHPGRSGWEAAELLLVGTAVAGTMLAGLLCAALPSRAVSLAGSGAGSGAGSTFLVRQTGVLLMVLAVGYLVEFRRSRSVVLLLTAEGLTAAFLLASWLDDRLRAQLLLVALQGWLGALTWGVHALAERRRWARVELKLVVSGSEPYRPAGGGG